MTPGVRTAIALVGWVFATFAPGAVSPARAAAGGGGIVTTIAGRCGVCHPAERVAHSTSRHAAEGVTCVACHGGNAASLDRGTAHGGDFRARLSRRDIPARCASCHADRDMMRPYDIPIDQFALYQVSGHGRALARGNERAAVCTDCHGPHDIRPASDPQSPIYVLNIPRTCGKCHGGVGPDSTARPAHGDAGRGVTDSTRKTMGSGIYADYVGSVHGRELLERGNRRAPTCVSCHGVHGAAPPDVGDVDKVCGRCHTAERRHFVSGPHPKAMIAKGLPECAACHGNHAVAEADPAGLERICGDCHGDDSPERKLGARLYADYQDASRTLQNAEERIRRADAIPIPTDDYRSRLEQARTYLREALPAAHSVQPEVVGSFTTRARAVGEEIRTEIDHALSERRWIYVGLVLFWFYVVLTLLLLRRYRNRSIEGR